MIKKILIFSLMFFSTPLFADFVFPVPRSFPPKIESGTFSHSGNTESTAFTVDVREGSISQVIINIDLSNLSNSVIVRVFEEVDGINLRQIEQTTVSQPASNNAGFSESFIVVGDVSVTLDSIGNESPAKDVPFAHATFRFR